MVTGVDDHSRFCVIAKVVERATGRAVCLAFAAALARFGVPEEVITDNGKQFTDRFGKGGEVLFDRICRENGITHRLTAPASPNQNGKVERFHGTLPPRVPRRRGAVRLAWSAAQAAVDAWVAQYNTDRPHQGLDETVPVTPARAVQPRPGSPSGSWSPLWLPAVALTAGMAAPLTQPRRRALTPGPASAQPAAARRWPVEFDRVVPPSREHVVCRAAVLARARPRRAGGRGSGPTAS